MTMNNIFHGGDQKYMYLWNVSVSPWRKKPIIHNLTVNSNCNISLWSFGLLICSDLHCD